MVLSHTFIHPENIDRGATKLHRGLSPRLTCLWAASLTEAKDAAKVGV